MTAPPPSPTSLTTWEEAFAHPLPTTRHLEQTLRLTISAHRAKLRALVGTSYRDLLSTAERIIEMDEQMHRVEKNLGEMGRKCNARAVERVGENEARMRRGRGEGGRVRVVAGTRVLGNALVVVEGVVQRKGEALVGAKVLVLARVVCRGLVEGDGAPGVVGELRKRLAGLRRRLMGFVEGRVAGEGRERGELVGGLCAYALVTSSAPREVLRHFLQVRYRVLEGKAELGTEAGMGEVLEVYGRTLMDTREVFPRRFAEALAQLAKVPLLQDEQVRACAELELDVYDCWIDDSLKTFTPWVRHEPLTSAEVGEAMKSWMGQAQQCLLAGLRESLRSQMDLRALFHTRQKFIEKFMVLGSKLHSDSHIDAIDQVRAVFLERLLELAVEAGSLADVFNGQEEEKAGVQRKDSLWDLAMDDFDLSNGALSLRKAVISSRHGRTSAAEKQTRRLDDWLTRIHSTLDVAEEMRSSRWDKDIDFELDGLDDHDNLLEALNKSDPAAVMRALRDATAQSFDKIIEKVGSTDTRAEDAPHHLRIWREVDVRRRALQSSLDLPLSSISLADLYQKVARQVATQPLADYTHALRSSSHVAKGLWDGSPPLPLQPSPATFRFLNALASAMAEVGSDLWSVQGVGELKGVVVEGLVGELGGERLVNGHVEGDGKEEEEGGGREDVVLQRLFDVHYLGRALQSSGGGGDGLGRVVTTLRESLKMEEGVDERVQRNAHEYWKKTYLLFGVLAP